MKRPKKHISYGIIHYKARDEPTYREVFMQISQNNTAFNYIDSFSADNFLKPGKDSQVVYGWVWNGNITREKIKNQIDSMCENHIKSVYIIAEPTAFNPVDMCTYMEPDYFTKEYLELFKYAADYSLKKGMNFWIYDEGGWPSGSANGEVCMKNPELICRKISAEEKKLPAGKTYTCPANALSAFNEANERVTQYIPVCDESVVEFYVKDYKREGKRDFPDLLNKKTTDKFIEYTHVRYKKLLSENFGSAIKVFFTDEPYVSEAQYNDELRNIFVERYGYDFVDFLPAIVLNRSMGEAGNHARIDYFDLVGELYAQNYFKVIQKWCRENGAISTGHVDGDNVTRSVIEYRYLNPLNLRFLRCLDIPGIDVIWRQIFPGMHPDYSNNIHTNPFFPRLASSAANQTGSHSKLTESFGVYGNGLTYDQMRYIINAQAVRGINLFNPLLLCLDQYDYFRGGERPNFPLEMPGKLDKAVFHDYAARITYLTSIGRPNASTALYMPSRDMWVSEHEEYIARAYEKTGMAIERAHGEFDIIDDDVILNAEIADGALKIGLAKYCEIWFSPCENLSERVRKRLNEFIKCGGVIYCVNDDISPKLDGAVLVDDISKAVKPLVKCLPENEGILAMKRSSENEDIYYIFNEGTENVSVKLVFENDKTLYVPDLETGNVYISDIEADEGGTTVKADILSGEMKVYIFSDREIKRAIHTPVLPQKLHSEISEFRLRPIRSFVIGKHLFESSDLNEKSKIVSCGDWQNILGKEFSGDAIYGFDLEKTDSSMIMLDFGRVNYSCELYINGQSYGVRCMPPYRYVIDTSALLDENKAELRVSNTSANQFVYTREFDHASEGEKGPYHERAIHFEKESLESGLIGPVRVFVK